MAQTDLEKQLELQRAKIAEMARFPEMNPGPVLRMNTAGDILLSNSAASAVFGESLLTRSWLDVCPGLSPSLWKEILASPTIFPFETEIGTKSFVFQHRFDQTSGLVFVYGNDITINKQNEKKLEEQRAAIAEIARFPDMNPGPVLRMDLEGLIKLSNKAAQDLFGENITGGNWVGICPSMSPATWKEILGSPKIYPFETKIKDLDFVFNHRVDPLTSLVFVFGTDVSLQKKAEIQLRHAEKMASLGELTAGIAHEIQNPLNFINNFSELNAELIEELTKLVQDTWGRNDNMIPEELNTLLEDIKGNEHKISYHGKRADAIVKSMLQHSRSSGGERSPTDINAMVEEFSRLAYHGLRATDREFAATYTLEPDPSLPKLNIVSSEIGIVLLNLVNNAFYAVMEKKKSIETGKRHDYLPCVCVKTIRTGDRAQIIVSDNGTGIPPSIREKIFQPFFTTKPTGQGTGLGLSLSYEIIKAQGGDLRLETREGEGASFIIELPFA